MNPWPVDPLTAFEEERPKGWRTWDPNLCPACHHKDHDPGSCNWCPACELHTDEALDFVLRIEPELLAQLGYFRPENAHLAHHSHLGAIVIVAAVVVLSAIAAALLLGMGR